MPFCTYCQRKIPKNRNVAHMNPEHFPKICKLCSEKCKKAYEQISNNKTVHIWSIGDHYGIPFFILHKVSLSDSPVSLHNKRSISFFSRGLNPIPSKKLLRLIMESEKITAELS